MKTVTIKIDDFDYETLMIHFQKTPEKRYGFPTVTVRGLSIEAPDGNPPMDIVEAGASVPNSVTSSKP